MASDAQNAIPVQFPHDDVLKALDEWWEHEKADAVLPDDETVPDIMKPSVEIDSHCAVRALITLEEVVKFPIPEGAIKEGGYDGLDELKAHLIPVLVGMHEEKRKKQHA